MIRSWGLSLYIVLSKVVFSDFDQNLFIEERNSHPSLVRRRRRRRGEEEEAGCARGLGKKKRTKIRRGEEAAASFRVY